MTTSRLWRRRPVGVWVAGVFVSLGWLAVFSVANPRSGVAQTIPVLDVRIERVVDPSSLLDDLTVNLKITLSDHATGQPPAERFAVVAQATGPQGQKTAVNPCGQIRDNDPNALPGLYACSVIVDYGGTWTFEVVVNRERFTTRDPVKTVARADEIFDVQSAAVAKAGKATAVKGRASEVVFLWGHSVVAAVWFFCVAVLALLAIPEVRRHLSSFVLHRLEHNFESVLKVLWFAAAGTVGTGTYLLLKQAAYTAPFSIAAIRGVFSLPYGKVYFLSLWVKMGLYSLMLVGSVVLTREARRQIGPVPDTPVPIRTGDQPPNAPHVIWGGTPVPTASRPSGTATVIAARTSAPVPTVTTPGPKSHATSRTHTRPWPARLGTAIIFVNGIIIWICVTLLKYFHELIEAVRPR